MFSRQKEAEGSTDFQIETTRTQFSRSMRFGEWG